MIVWTGLGAYAFVIPFFLWLGTLFVAQTVLGKSVADAYGQLINGLVLLVSAGIVGLIARRLAAKPARVLVDKATGQEVTLQERHTMFAVPMRYWAFLYAGLGIVLVVLGIGSVVS